MIPLSSTAFQRNAFQTDAFQIGVEVGGGGDRWLPLAMRLRAQELAERERLRREKEQEEDETPVMPVLEVVEARAEPIITDLAATLRASVTPAMTKAQRDEADLQAFLSFMCKLATEEETEC